MLWRHASADAFTSAGLGAVLAAVLVSIAIVTAGATSGFDSRRAGVSTVDVSTRAGAAVARGDGMNFDALARDPLLRRPEVFRGGPSEAAYWAARPVYGWTAWLFAGGQAAAIPWAVLGLGIPFAFLAALGFATLLGRRRASPKWAVAVVVLPGAICAITWGCSDVAALAFATWAVVWWTSGRRSRAVVACIAAALTRETMLLVPSALVVWSVAVRRERHRAALARAVAPFVAYAGWIGVVRWRFGAWPIGVEDRLGLPFEGVRAVVDGIRPVDVASLATVLVAAAGVARAPQHEAAVVAALFLVAATVFGPAVWNDWVGFARVLLPAAAFGLIAFVSPTDARSADGAGGHRTNVHLHA